MILRASALERPALGCSESEEEGNRSSMASALEKIWLVSLLLGCVPLFSYLFPEVCERCEDASGCHRGAWWMLFCCLQVHFERRPDLDMCVNVSV